MKYSYISILTTDNYLFGALVLWKSLLDTKPKYPFHLLVSPNLSEQTYFLLEKSGIPIIRITPIKNPILNDPKDRRYYNYSKLNMWNMTQFDKIVYLDADMLIMHNIDELFEKKNLSSTNSGGWLPGKKDWKQLNSGLIVLEPSENIFNHMKSQVGIIEKEKGKGDQAFLHQYYNDWPDKTELHLPHVYNVFDCLIDGYKKNFGYYLDEVIQYNNDKYDEKRIKVVHYVGQHKPWMEVEEIKNSKKTDPEMLAKKIWIRYYKETKKFIRDSVDKQITQTPIEKKTSEIIEPDEKKNTLTNQDQINETTPIISEEEIIEKSEIDLLKEELEKTKLELESTKEELLKTQNELNDLKNKFIDISAQTFELTGDEITTEEINNKEDPILQNIVNDTTDLKEDTQEEIKDNIFPILNQDDIDEPIESDNEDAEN